MAKTSKEQGKSTAKSTKKPTAKPVTVIKEPYYENGKIKIKEITIE
jgi:hypothetical protein